MKHKKNIFTVNELLSDFEIFKRVHSQLLDWFVDFDIKYFSEFFSDKHDWIDIRIPPDEDNFWVASNSRAYWDAASGSIAFDPLFVTYGLEDDIKYVLLHEMIHVFIDSVYPSGKRHTDNSKVFVEWSMLLRCPIVGCVEASGNKKITICVWCGRTVHRTYRPKVFNS